jgi:hypothetical protein
MDILNIVKDMLRWQAHKQTPLEDIDFHTCFHYNTLGYVCTYYLHFGRKKDSEMEAVCCLDNVVVLNGPSMYCQRLHKTRQIVYYMERGGCHAHTNNTEKQK